MHFAITLSITNNLNLPHYLKSLLNLITVKLIVGEYPIHFKTSLSLAAPDINYVSRLYLVQTQPLRSSAVHFSKGLQINSIIYLVSESDIICL